MAICYPNSLPFNSRVVICNPTINNSAHTIIRKVIHKYKSHAKRIVSIAITSFDTIIIRSNVILSLDIIATQPIATIILTNSSLHVLI